MKMNSFGKIVASLVTVVGVFALVGCGKNAELSEGSEELQGGRSASKTLYCSGTKDQNKGTWKVKYNVKVEDFGQGKFGNARVSIKAQQKWNTNANASDADWGTLYLDKKSDKEFEIKKYNVTSMSIKVSNNKTAALFHQFFDSKGKAIDFVNAVLVCKY